MSSSQPTVLELAKQGNSKAIAALINHQLQPKGITAKAALKNDCLQIMLESSETPIQQHIVPFIYKGILGLNVTSIKLLKIYGRQTSEEFPAWMQEIRLAEQSAVEMTRPSVTAQSEVQKEQTDLSNLEERAKQGDTLALEKLINRSVQHRDITARLNRKANTLQIVLESDEVPNKDLSVAIIRRELNKLKIESIISVEVDGRKRGERLPLWSEKVELSRSNSSATLIHTPQPTVEVDQVTVDTPQNLESQIKCPKCGSTQIHANNKGFGLGKAAVGGVLFGPVGLLGGMMGSNQIRLTCLKCGHRYQPGK